MATFTVTTAADVIDGSDGKLSLREAVAQAYAVGAADTIRFAAAVESKTLVLTDGQLMLTRDVTIDGDSNDDGQAVTIDGNQSGRVLNIAGASTDEADRLNN